MTNKLSIIFALLILTNLLSNLSAISKDDDFTGFVNYSYYSGDGVQEFYINNNTIRIKNRSLGSRYNKYDQELYYELKYENGIPFVYYIESDINYVSNDISDWGEEPFEIKKVEKVKKKAILFLNNSFFALIDPDGLTTYFGTTNSYNSWEYHISEAICLESSYLLEEALCVRIDVA